MAAAASHMLVMIAGFSLIGGPLAAQTIYPIDRAAILAGARFDFKVEFPAIENQADLKITIDGEDYTRQLGKAGQFVENEPFRAVDQHRRPRSGPRRLALDPGDRDVRQASPGILFESSGLSRVAHNWCCAASPRNHRLRAGGTCRQWSRVKESDRGVLENASEIFFWKDHAISECKCRGFDAKRGTSVDPVKLLERLSIDRVPIELQPRRPEISWEECFNTPPIGGPIGLGWGLPLRRQLFYPHQLGLKLGGLTLRRTPFYRQPLKLRAAEALSPCPRFRNSAQTSIA